MDKILISQMDRVELGEAARLILDELSEEDALDVIQEFVESNDMNHETIARLEGR